jgi:protein involved in sex pheromone biosynthesis
MKKVFVFFLAATCLITTEAQKGKKKKPCPKYGDATTQQDKTLNKKKNRGVNPKGTAEYVPLRNFLPSKKRIEKDLYSEDAYIYTEGYLTSIEEQGPESCNCRESTKKNKDGDVHMFLGLTPAAPKKNCMVIEITPAYKKKHPDYADNLQKGEQYTVYGYLMYDTEHTGSAFTTCKKCGHTWRKTNWEIHPVTSIERVE